MCVFSAFALRAMPRGESVQTFFFASAAITMMLLFDDLFLFHDLAHDHPARLLLTDSCTDDIGGPEVTETPDSQY